MTIQENANLNEHLERLRAQAPAPVLWLFGKTQSGKTSIVRFLTGAEDAEIGRGFKPCTRFSRLYRFPTNAAPLLIFLDTRGLDEPGYDPAEDLDLFNDQAHLQIVTVKLLDPAQENVRRHLQAIRHSQPTRPVILALTCLHEAYPQRQHPPIYPFNAEGEVQTPADDHLPDALVRAIAEQKKRFEGLCDYVVPLDLTPAAEGFAEPNYGGQQLKEVLVQALPGAYRQTLIRLDEATRELQDAFARQALPYILGYSTLAAGAGAVPIPWIDLLLLPGIQTRMVHHLARLYGQPLDGQRFLELAGSLLSGLILKQAVRGVVKFIPFVGSIAGAALAGAATYALGKAFCYYYSAVHKGHVPRAEEVRAYFQEQLAQAESTWRKGIKA